MQSNNSKTTGEWRIKGKNLDSIGNTIAYNTYGTQRINAYEILEATLNLRDARVYDRVETDGTVRYVVNKTETMYAAQKQDAIKEAFQEWIYADLQRRRKYHVKHIMKGLTRSVHGNMMEVTWYFQE